MAGIGMNRSSAGPPAEGVTNVTTTKLPYVPVAPNATLPPEQYRFIPGSTPTFVNGTVITPRLKEPAFNSTGYYIEDGEQDTGFDEIQTLFLACFATLIPLVIILATGFTIRLLWKRYKRRRNCINYDGVVHRDNSIESNERPLHAHLLNGDKLGETHLNGEEIGDGEILNGITSSQQQSPISLSQPARSHSTANGSIITMTLKNNHLIVETEERNDIEEDSRETTMRYSPSARDGIFVVEVAQGGRRANHTENRSTPFESNEMHKASAQIHPAPDVLNASDEADENAVDNDDKLRPCHTGLSQSNQSLTNQSYTYSTQHGYDNGHYGYPEYAGYVNNEPMRKLESHSKPRITAAIYKSNESFDQLDCVDDDQKEQIRLGNENPIADNF